MDLGCGPGDYALAAAEIVGATGHVYAVDIWRSMVQRLRIEARQRGLANLHCMVADITTTLPFPDAAMDVCLIATVLHIPKVTSKMAAIGSEIRRVLRPDGRLAIIECKKKEAAFGPPLDLRLASKEIQRSMAAAGFRASGVVDLGPNYLIHFVV
jgi:ubiquinone/menaquinone biosynthesis C-methylase UbiE